MSAIKRLKPFSLLTLALFFAISPALAQNVSHADAEEFETVDDSISIDPVSEARLDRALAVIEADQSLQKTRPEWEPEAPEPVDPRGRDGPHPIAEAIASFFRAIGGVLGYILALIILIAILAGLYMVFGESLTLRGKQKEKAAGPDHSTAANLQPEEARARALLEDADALAAQGRFAEAVHLLLFRSIDDIQQQRSGLIGRSLTAREIGALSGLPDTVRGALMPIIRVVERSFFGGQEVTETGWKDARASYASFAFGEAWT